MTDMATGDLFGSAPAGSARVRQAVFVDARVEQLDRLQAGAAPGVAVFGLAEGEGLERVAELLDSHGLTGLEAVHLIAHGAEGTLLLGDAGLTAAALPGHAAALAAIGAAIADDGDLLLFACDAGAGEAGAQLVADLARFTGADVAASVDAVGAAALGGDWTLEVSSGPIEAGVPFTAETAEAFDSLLAATVTASQTVALAPGGDTDADGVVDPGETVRFTVTINNAGPDAAANLSYSNALSGLTLVGGSTRITPIAFDDAVSLTGNTPIDFSLSSLLANDIDPDASGGPSNAGLTLVSFTQPSVGGAVSYNSGTQTFTFTPTTGYTGTTSFQYTVQDAQGLQSVSTGVVDLTVSGLVWYVDSAAAAGGDGSFGSAFQSLAPLNGAGNNGATAGDVDDVGATIFVYDRGAAYTGGITLETGQTLLGDGAALTVNGKTIGASASNAQINFSGAGVTLASGNTVSGVTLNGTGTAAVALQDGAATVGALNVSAVTISGAGKAVDIDQGGVLNVTLTSLSSTGSTSEIVDLQGVSGAFNVNGGSVAGATTTTVNVSTASTLNVSYQGSLAHAAGTGALISIGGGHTGTVEFTGTKTASSGTGLQFSNADGSYTFTNTTSLNGGDAGIDIVAGTDAANGSTGTFDFSSSTSITSPSGVALNVDGSRAEVRYNGTITKTTDGRAVVVNNEKGGTVDINGAVSSTASSDGVQLTGNTGATVRFDGGLTISGTGNAAGANAGAFSATGGGTVVVTGTTNTIATTASGHALQVENTTIGSGGLNFQSINSTGGGYGVLLNNTGATGGLTVTGTGAANSGGTIQNTNDDAVRLTSVTGVSFDNVRIQNVTGGGDGVDGADVTNFTFTDGSVTSVGAGGSAFNFSRLIGNNLDGAVDISRNTIFGVTDAVKIANYAGTISNLQLNNNNVSGSASASTAFNINALGTAGGAATITTGSISTNTISGEWDNHAILVQGGNSNEGATGAVIGNSAANRLVIQNNQINSAGLAATAAVTGDAIAFAMSGEGAGQVLISGNTVRNVEFGAGIAVAAFDDTDVVATISGNTVAGTPINYGIYGTADVKAGFASNSPTLTVTIENNSSTNTGYAAIGLQASSDQIESNNNWEITAKISGNTATAGSQQGGFYGIQVSGGTIVGGDNDVRLKIENNSATGSAGYEGILLTKDDDNSFGQFQIDGLTGGTTSTAVDTYVTGRNPGSTVSVAGENWSSGTVPLALVSPEPAEPVMLTLETLAAAEPVLIADAITLDGAAVVNPLEPATPLVTEPVRVAPSEAAAIVNDGVLNQAELDTLLAAAVARWEQTGLTAEQSAALRAVRIEAAHLSGWEAAAFDEGVIRIDLDAAGVGWFEDATPMDDGEFGPGGARRLADSHSAAHGRIDALTVIMHELGHALGLADRYDVADRDGLLYGYMFAGERRLPGYGAAEGARPGSVEGEAFAIGPVNVGTLPNGKSVQVIFDATVNAQSNGMIVDPAVPGAVSWTGGSVGTTGANSITLDTLTLGDRIFLDADRSGAFNAGDSGISGVSLSLFVDANDDGAPDGAAIATTTTNGTGNYSFGNLAPGTYLVGVVAANFTAGQALAGLRGRGAGADPDDNVDGDDNSGTFTAGQPVYSRPITLAYNTEPTNGTGNDANSTLDLGFVLTNVAPSFSSAGATATYVENAAATAFAGTITVSDSDSATYAGGQLTIALTAGSVAGDALSLNTTGSVSLDGTDVKVGGTTVGVLTATATSLSIALNASADDAAVKAISEAARFASSSNDPTGAARTVTFTLKDGGGTEFGGADTTSFTRTVNVTPVNDAPTFTKGADQTVSEDAGAQTITGWATNGNTIEAGQTLSYQVSSNNPGLFTVQPSINAAGDLTFTTAANAFGGAVISVQARDNGGILNGGSDTSAAQTFNISVTPVTDTPSVTGASTQEDVQTTSGLVITRNAADGLEVSHVKISGVTNGTLFLNDGVTAIANGDFITFAQANAGLKFTPAANAFGTGSFQAQASTSASDAGLGGAPVTATINVTAVADTPTVTGAATLEDTQTASGLVFTRNAVDGAEVTHVKVTGITGGTLYLNDGTTAVANGTFLTYAQANAGLKFTPAANAETAGGFNVQASTAANDAGLGGSVVPVAVAVTPVNDAPLFSATGAAASYSENAAAIAIAGAVTVSDIDSANFAGGALTIALSDSVAGDTLSLGGGVTVVGSDVRIGVTSVGTLTATATSLSIALNASADDAAVKAIAEGVRFASTSDAPTSAARTATFTLVDGGGVANNGQNTTSFTRTVNVTPVNDAPTLSVTPITLTGTTEDAPSAGQLVSELLALAGYGDVDLGPVGGAAVSAVSGTGAWQYSTDGGATWAAVGAVSTGAALLLSTTTRVRFNPTGNDGQTASLSFYGWDGTAGSPSTNGARSTLDATTRGGATSVSSASSAGQLAVSAINDAPTLAATGGARSFTEGGAASDLFSAVTAGTVETGQTLQRLTLTVSGLVDGASERLTVDGTTVSLVDGATAVTSGLGGAVSVAVTGTTAAVTFDKTGGITPAQMQALVDALAYSNTSGNPGGTRTVTLTSLQDSGGTANGGVDTGTPTGTAAIVTLTATNTAPTITPVGQTLAATTEDAPSSAVLVSALLTAAGFSDSDGPSSGVAVTAADGAGGWTYSVNGGASWIAFGALAPGNALLLSSTTQVRFEPNGSNGGTATLSLRGWDGTTGSASTATPSYGNATSTGGQTAFSAAVETLTTSFTDSPDAPQVTSGETAGYSENDPPTVITPAGTVIDPDTGATFEGGTLSAVITAGGEAADRLTVLSVGSIAADSDTGEIYYEGNYVGVFGGGAEGEPLVVRFDTAVSTPVVAQSILRAIGFSSISEDPSQTPRTVTFTARSADGLSGSATATVTVAAVDDRASVLNSSATVFEGQDVPITPDSLLAVDPDGDSAAIRYQVTAPPAAGVLRRDGVALALGASFTQADVNALRISYQHDGSEPMGGGDSVQFDVFDDQGLVGASGLSLTVLETNDAPVVVATAGPSAVNEQTSVALVTTFSVSDVEYDAALSVLFGASLTVRATANGSIFDRFTTSLTSGGVRIEGGQNGEPLVITFDRDTSPNEIEAWAQSLRYTYAGDAPSGEPVAIAIEFRDGGGRDNGGNDTAVVTRTVVVNNVQDAATVVASTVTVAEGGSVVVTPAMLNVVDPDAPGGVTYNTSASGFRLNGVAATSFTAADVTAGRVSYVQNGDETTPSAGFSADDGRGSVTPFTVAFNVTPVNDAPTLANPIPDQAGTEDTTFSYTLPANTFADVDNASLTLSATLADGSALPSWLTFTPGTRTFSGTPPLNFNGPVDVRVTASDGALSVSDDFRITISPVNDAPTVANAIPDQAGTEDTAFSYTLPANTFADVDSATLTLSATLADGSALPSWLTFDPATRQFSGTPPLNYNGALDVRVTASDGALSVSDDFRISIAPVNDAPVVANVIPDQSGTEDTPFSYTLPANTFADVDNATLTLSATLADGSALPSWLTFDPATRQFSGTPPLNDNGAFDVRVTASDGVLTVSDEFRITIAAVNDAPTVANAIPDQAGTEDTAFSFTVPATTFTDVDDATLTLSATLADGSALPSWLAFDPATRQFSGTPPLNFNGPVDVRVTASDGALSVSDDFRISIAPVNDAPVFTGGATVAYTEAQPAVQVAPAASVSDVDSPNFGGGSLTATIAGGLAEDQLSLIQTGGVSVLAGVVSVGGVAIGTVSGGAAGAPLTVALNGDATAARVQALAQAVAYANSSSDPSTAARTVTLTVVDGDGGADRASISSTVSVAAINTAPIAVSEVFSTPQFGRYVSNVLANDSDPDGPFSGLYVAAVTPLGGATQIVPTGGVALAGQNGVLEIRGDGATAYTPTIQDLEVGAIVYDTFDYTVLDPGGAGGSGRITAVITGSAFGNEAANTLRSGAASDTLYGYGGNDRLIGGGGMDRLFGGAGDDLMEGGAGDDFAFGAGGTDTFRVNANFADVTVRFFASGVLLISAEGTDLVYGVDRFQFADRTIERDAADGVDDLWYLSTYRDVAASGLDADDHFWPRGSFEGRNPNAFFDKAFYLAAHPEVSGLGFLAYNHYLQQGYKLGYDPSVAFDTVDYQLAHPGIGDTNPLLAHLAAVGDLIDLRSLEFDDFNYLMANPDVAAAGIDPFTHYRLAGQAEGRGSGALFDRSGYLAAYPDVAASGVDALTHYLQFGWRDGRDPSGAFDTDDYLAAYPDIAASGINPLVHYLTEGRFEGRSAFADGLFD